MKEIKQRFYALRNGMIADAYHKAGDPHRVVFGLQIPQISSIACEIKDTEDPARVREIAETLRGDMDVRESRLLAYYLYQPDEITPEKAIEMAGETQSQEEADILSFRLLQHLPYAKDLQLQLRKLPAAQRTLKALSRFL